MAEELFVGIDVGGTTVKEGLVNREGKILSKLSVPTPPLVDEAGYAAVIDGIKSLLDAQDGDVVLKGIGLAVPAPVPDDGDVKLIANASIDLQGLGAALRDAFGGAVVAFVNDANAAALGEMWRGSALGHRSMALVTLGTGIGEEFDVSKLRYHKVFIMADADVDGSHICTLMLTFFFRFMRPLIDGGFVYIAQPPLFKLQKGQQVKYAYSESEMTALSAGMPGAKINRYKGLGEMNPEQLWETTMDPNNRVIVQISIEDAEKADEAFTILMGDKVEPRREFIEENAVYAQNLDI
mgnify:CR=1 FL=1